MTTLDSLINPQYDPTAAGQLNKAKDALNTLRSIVGSQPWLEMCITIIDFQQTLLSRPALKFAPIDKAIKVFFK